MTCVQAKVTTIKITYKILQALYFTCTKLHMHSRYHIKQHIMQQIPNLPQQPNCTIHESKVAPTHRPVTPTADFSATEAPKAMTMTVGYPGKNSVDDVRKEQVPEPQKCQQ
jgi:hypothetical protein